MGKRMKRVGINIIIGIALVAFGAFLFYFCSDYVHQAEGYVNYVGQSECDVTYRFESGDEITYSHDEARIMAQFIDSHYSDGYYAGYYIRHNGLPGKPIYLWWDDPKYGFSIEGPMIRIVTHKERFRIGNTLLSFNITEEGGITPRM